MVDLGGCGGDVIVIEVVARDGLGPDEASAAERVAGRETGAALLQLAPPSRQRRGAALAQERRRGHGESGKRRKTSDNVTKKPIVFYPENVLPESGVERKERVGQST